MPLQKRRSSTNLVTTPSNGDKVTLEPRERKKLREQWNHLGRGLYLIYAVPGGMLTLVGQHTHTAISASLDTPLLTACPSL